MADHRELASHAQTLLRRTDYAGALRVCRELLTYDHIIDYEYDDWLRATADTLKGLRQSRLAAMVYTYLHYYEQALQHLPSAEESVMAIARVFALRGDNTRAAAMYTNARRWVHAAIAHEKARDHAAARAAWSALLDSGALAGDKYLEALARVNIGLCCDKLGDAVDSRKHLARASTLLEEAASAFESQGERERAFDCYQVVLRLGREIGAYENIAEGYLNSIRVLKEDNLRFYVLQYYEDFQRLSEERAEYHAAATLYREAADYAAKCGMPYDGYYLAKAGDTWLKVAQHNIERGVVPELTENALLAAVDAFNAFGDFVRVRDTYRRLANLGLSDKRKRRYAKILTRYSDVESSDVYVHPLPDYLKRNLSYYDVWYTDLVEWELDGDYELVAASLIGDRDCSDVVRRRALLLLLNASVAQQSGADELQSRIWVCQQLGRLMRYEALYPLEKIFEHTDARVRAAAVRALTGLPFKRSFHLVRRALADAEPVVQEAARQTLGELYFPHAFEPLVRVFQESTDVEVRTAALRAIGRIDTIEAADQVINALLQEGPAIQRVAVEVLVAYDNPGVIDLLRRHLATARGEHHQLLQQALRRVDLRR